jgi:SAM-dependent methyltransferase
MEASADIFVRQFSPFRAAHRPALVDWNYTRHFSEEFRHQEARQYHRKFPVRFEKTVKHRQQVAVIGKYLRKNTRWLDAPIGSGRLMDELTSVEQSGFDRSPSFVDFNRAKGRTVIEGDLLDFPFVEKFDIITTLHTLPAFSKYTDILASLARGLRPGGILIADINNARHTAARRRAGDPTCENPGMNRNEILKLNLYSRLDRLSQGRPEHIYTKYLLVARKAKSHPRRANDGSGPERKPKSGSVSPTEG